GSLSALPGTIVPAPVPVGSADGVPFATCGLYHDQAPPIWFLEGTINKQQFAAGETLIIKGKLRIESHSLVNPGPLAVTFRASVDLLAGHDGTPAIPHGI